MSLYVIMIKRENNEFREANKMINELNIEIFDYIFSTNIELKENYLEQRDINYLYNKLNDIII